MEAAIVSAIITGCVSLAVCVITMRNQNRQMELRMSEERRVQSEAHLASVNELKTEIAVLKAMFSDLTAKVEKHNNVIERTYELEKKTSVLEAKIGGTKNA